MRSTLPHPAPRHFVTLLGSGVVVMLTGWIGPMDGAAGETRGTPCGTALWDESALLAQVLKASAPAGAKDPQPRLVAEAPPAVGKAAIPPLRRRAVRRGPIRLGIALPPMVCVAETCAPSDLLVEPPNAGAAIHAGVTGRALTLQRHHHKDGDRLRFHRERYRLAPKGSPPA